MLEHVREILLKFKIYKITACAIGYLGCKQVKLLCFEKRKTEC